MKSMVLVVAILIAVPAFAQASPKADASQREICATAAEKQYKYVIGLLHETDRILHTEETHLSLTDRYLPDTGVCYAVISGMSSPLPGASPEVPLRVFTSVWDAFEHTSIASYDFSWTANAHPSFKVACAVKNKLCLLTQNDEGWIAAAPDVFVKLVHRELGIDIRGDVAGAKVPQPIFQNGKYSCPAGFYLYSSEEEVRAGEDGAHCINTQ